MAQYSWTALASDDGQAPSNMGFTHRWNSGLTVKVDDLATLGSIAPFLSAAGYDAGVSLTSTDNDNRALSFDSFDGTAIPQNATDVEVYIEQVLQGAFVGNGYSLVRGRDDGAGRRAYAGNVIRIAGKSPRIAIYNPDFTVLSDSPGHENFELVASRFRVIGNELKIKSWEVNNEAEPGWDLQITDSDIAAGGWIGYQKYGGDSNFQRIVIPFIGIGTDGDSAPTAPVPTGPTTPTNLTTTNITSTGFRSGWTA